MILCRTKINHNGLQTLSSPCVLEHHRYREAFGLGFQLCKVINAHNSEDCRRALNLRSKNEARTSLAELMIPAKPSYISFLSAQQVESNHSDVSQLQVWSLHPGPPKLSWAEFVPHRVVYIYGDSDVPDRLWELIIWFLLQNLFNVLFNILLLIPTVNNNFHELMTIVFYNSWIFVWIFIQSGRKPS